MKAEIYRLPKRAVYAAFVAGAVLMLAGCATSNADGQVAMAALPTATRIQHLVDEAHAKYKGLKEGANANYIPILDTVPSELFAVVIATKDGKIYSAGDGD